MNEIISSNQNRSFNTLDNFSDAIYDSPKPMHSYASQPKNRSESVNVFKTIQSDNRNDIFY